MLTVTTLHSRRTRVASPERDTKQGSVHCTGGLARGITFFDGQLAAERAVPMAYIPVELCDASSSVAATANDAHGLQEPES